MNAIQYLHNSRDATKAKKTTKSIHLLAQRKRGMDADDGWTGITELEGLVLGGWATTSLAVIIISPLIRLIASQPQRS